MMISWKNFNAMLLENWKKQRNKQLMEGVITPLSSLKAERSEILKSHQRYSRDASVLSQKLDGLSPPNCVAPITDDPSEAMFHAKDILRTVIMIQAPHMIRDRKYHLRTYRQCMIGTEMVDWLMQYSTLVLTRIQAVGMWQALLEEGVIAHVCEEHPFRDKYLFYRFVDGRTDTMGTGGTGTGSTSSHVLPTPPTMELKHYEEELADVLKMLSQVGPDAIMRMILRKPSCERTPEDLEIIYEELLHIKALSHLSTMVKRELASVLMFESHTKKGTVLFRQGDEGKSWYIILKGSVNVSIYGKGIVCKLQEGDDFGKLALVNDAPRSATICLCEDNCHFLRVDKDDFNRILRDVEANTVRLNEHGQDVLVLEKMPTNVQAQDGSIQSHYKYSVMAGTPEKILEHLLETRMEKNESDDHFLESFLLTHVIFMPTKKLCPALMMHYEAISGAKDESHDIILSHKRRVIQFVQEWQSISGEEFLEDNTISAFLKELQHTLSSDSLAYPELKNDVSVIEHMMQARLSNNTMEPPKYSMKKRLTPNVILARKGSKENVIDESKFRRGSIKAADESIFRVYCADHSYCTLRVPMTTTVSQIINQAQEKLALGEDLVLCEVKSNGERILFRENDLGVVNSLTLNGRLFLAPREHLDAVTPLPEQDEILTGTASSLELVGSQELAYHMTVYDWELFTAVPEYELIYQVFGRYKFGKTTANLDLFLRRFNEVQYWVVTEILLTQNLSKRVHLLRKFIKLASYCREYQNMSSFFAIVLGLSNIAVSRLSQTWEKLPGKLKKMFSEFETIMDPSRNHRVYRLSIAKMRPPIIPFMPLLMKDMTFTHEGNKTYYDGLVNFEKMHMIAQTLRTVRCCRSVPLNLDLPNSSVKPPFDVKSYVRSLNVMDNQRTLAQLSQKLEPRRT